MKKCLNWPKKPWFWVLLGVIMTSASALISHNVIMANSSVMETLIMQSQTIDQRIDNDWQGINRLERDGNVAMLMVMGRDTQPQGTIQAGVKQYITQLLAREGNGKQAQQVKAVLADSKATPAALFQALMGFISETRSETINIIDKTYLEKLHLQEQIEALKQHNSTYANLALFLQVMGLILVLSKDLARRTWPS